MGIPESQLETWSHQGAVTTAKATHESIRKALDSYEWRDGVNFEVYLQGSYKNSTNIHGDSDVDIVVQLTSTFKRDLSALSEDEKALYKQAYHDATYLWEHFRADVLRALLAYYGSSAVSEGNKAVKVAGGSNRLSADVVVCLQYRKYLRFRSTSEQRYVEGIAVYALRENRWVINFPKLHYDNGTSKNAQYKTNGWYKPTVRVFKNARTYLVDKGVIAGTLVPSYFLECLLYNVPDEHFGSNYQKTFLSVIEWLVNSFSNGRYQNFLCQNELLPLFGDTPEQWPANKAVKLLKTLIELCKEW